MDREPPWELYPGDLIPPDRPRRRVLKTLTSTPAQPTNVPAAPPSALPVPASSTSVPAQATPTEDEGDDGVGGGVEALDNPA